MVEPISGREASSWILDGAARGANRHPVVLMAGYSIGVLAVLGGVAALLIQHAR